MLTTDEALRVLQWYRGELRADYKYPEWNDWTERDCIFHVTLWRPSCNYGEGVVAGADTLVQAVSRAYGELLRREGVVEDTKPWLELP